MKSPELRARCDEKHIKALQAIARHEGVSNGEALRLLVRDRAKSLGLWPQRQAQQEA